MIRPNFQANLSQNVWKLNFVARVHSVKQCFDQRGSRLFLEPLAAALASSLSIKEVSVLTFIALPMSRARPVGELLVLFFQYFLLYPAQVLGVIKSLVCEH